MCKAQPFCLLVLKPNWQCEGGTPCRYCLRTKQPCMIPKDNKTVIFLNATKQGSNPAISRSLSSSSIPASITPDVDSRYVTHFNTAVLHRIGLAGSADQFRDVMPLLRESPPLQQAMMAVGALDVEKMNPELCSSGSSSALQYYRAGISSVQSELSDPNLRTNVSVLWSSFFLGLFELMFDTTGEGWLKHFLYGTSALLEYRGPAAHRDGAGRRFFLAVRIFEISRALIYSSESFLAQIEWRQLMATMWSGGSTRDWHPKEALFDLMLSCSMLTCRSIKTVYQVDASGKEVDQDVLRDLAEEGFVLRSRLYSWRQIAQEWSESVAAWQEDMQMTLALIYHNALSIYLSGIFDYHKTWIDHQIPTSVLSSSEIQAHVLGILTMVQGALKQDALAGILFFFPLRVAGARARHLEHQREIFRLLQLISQRGFVVADAFIMDLEDLWTKKQEET